MITASMDEGSRSSSAARESARCTVASVPASERSVPRSSAILRTRSSHGLTTGASSWTFPTPTSGPKCRLPIPETSAVASASLSCAHRASSRCRSSVSSSTSVLWRGSGLIEFFNKRPRRSGGNDRSAAVRRPPVWNRGATPRSSIPSLWRLSRVRWATSLACETRASGSMLQSTLARLAKPAIGLRSIPTLGMPSFLHSTRVVPVPQNGSRTRCVESTPNVSR